MRGDICLDQTRLKNPETRRTQKNQKEILTPNDLKQSGTTPISYDPS